MRKTLTVTEKKEYEYIIKAISAILNQLDSPIPYEKINWQSIKNQVKKSSVDAIFAEHIIKLSKFYDIPKDIIDSFTEIKNHAILVDSVSLFEIEKVLKTFDKYKVKNIPLKGYFMKQIYPQTYYRSLSDFDILFNENDLENVKKALFSIGYKYVCRDENQIHFQKNPYMYLEMHTTIVDSKQKPYKYLINQLDYSSLRENYSYSYQMSLEDFYLFLLVHHSAHFCKGGMGVRMVMDIYIFYKTYKDRFNFDYLSERLKMYKLEKFEQSVREIAFKWFSGAKPQVEFDKIENYILLSNTLGRIDVGTLAQAEKSDNADENCKKHNKISYLLFSIFPNKSSLCDQYSYLKKFPFLLPFAWIQMWGKRIFISRNVHIKRGLKNRLCYTNDDVAYFKGLLNSVGFDITDI